MSLGALKVAYTLTHVSLGCLMMCATTPGMQILLLPLVCGSVLVDRVSLVNTATSNSCTEVLWSTWRWHDMRTEQRICFGSSICSYKRHSNYMNVCLIDAYTRPLEAQAVNDENKLTFVDIVYVIFFGM